VKIIGAFPKNGFPPAEAAAEKHRKPPKTAERSSAGRAGRVAKISFSHNMFLATFQHSPEAGQKDKASANSHRRGEICDSYNKYLNLDAI
jgi:hypothetical protein